MVTDVISHRHWSYPSKLLIIYLTGTVDTLHKYLSDDTVNSLYMVQSFSLKDKFLFKSFHK